MKLTDLKKHLKECDQKELIQLISELYKTSKDVQSYLSVRFLGEEATDELFKHAVKKIENEFFPEKGHGKLRLNQAKNAITEFKKLTEDEFKTIELMITYVEQGVAFTNTYGDIDENFYYSMEKMYEKAVLACAENEEYYLSFSDRLKKILDDTDGIGWGFHDQFLDIYYQIVCWEEEE